MPYDGDVPAMYVDWDMSGQFEKIIVDWRCERAHSNRYWSVHNFVIGYAGFQNASNLGKITNFSIWDQNNKEANIEYLSENATGGRYTTEGVGCRIYKNISWEAARWYKMCIGVKTVADKTYFAQWYYDVSALQPRWELVGIISIEIPNLVLTTSTAFQEDWNFDGGIAAFSLTKCYGQNAANHSWSLFPSGTVKNIFNDGTTEWMNDKRNCFYEERLLNNQYEYIYVKSGKGVTVPDRDFPYHFTLYNLPNTPDAYPEWNVICRKAIKSVHSGLYISKGDNDTVIQKNSASGTAEKWAIKFADNDYFYIFDEYTNKAITVDQPLNGSDLKMQLLQIGNNRQMWKFEGNSTTGFYIVPKCANSMSMDIENAYYTVAPIQLWTKNSSAPQMRWNLL